MVDWLVVCSALPRWRIGPLGHSLHVSGLPFVTIWQHRHIVELVNVIQVAVVAHSRRLQVVDFDTFVFEFVQILRDNDFFQECLALEELAFLRKFDLIFRMEG